MNDHTILKYKTFKSVIVAYKQSIAVVVLSVGLPAVLAVYVNEEGIDIPNDAIN